MTSFTVGFTSEGTKLLSQMLGNKDFPYPKPMSLIKALVGQATDSENEDVVLDFFAGSGTTGHAVMSLNDEDGGNRQFILVSSTEATKKEPKKNVCRDITAKRLQSAIDGYSYRTPKGTTTVEGLGGEFAYMRANRIPRSTVAIDIRHDQIWYALQQLHANAISPYVENQAIQMLEGEALGHDVLYVSTMDKPVLDALQARCDAQLKPCVVYAWQPGVIRQRVKAGQMKVEKIPDVLIERFGRVDA